MRDTGLLHQLLGIADGTALHSHPKLGASWEGFVIEDVPASEPQEDAWFSETHQDAEIAMR